MKSVNKFTLSVCLAVIALSVNGVCAAPVEIDNGENAPFFKVNGTKVSPAEAVEAYAAGKIVEKCTPIRGAVDSEGKSTAVHRCKAVKLVMNGKTGNTTWKSL